ncbi:MAG: serine hydrolase domain-containing protein [Bacteroidota bacterium]|jgi:CubicO group peptidase (beta-lactamase class C family)
MNSSKSTKANFKILSLIFLCFNFFHFTLNAQQIHSSKLDSFLNYLNASNKGMGSVCITKHHIVQYHKSFGYSTINNNVKQLSNDSSKYRIASITKIFTSVLILQLIEGKKLSLITTLDKFYPKIPYAKDITIKQMLYHQSGLYDYLQVIGHFRTTHNRQ